jgi:D-glycero-D-manno-heptose 1,7-bisphosphate phosphatase
MTAGPARGAVFLDRDGVLNEDLGYVHRVADLRWIEGAREAVARINRVGLLAIVATNQSGVARGFCAEDDVRAFHAHMAAQLAAAGARVDAFYYCPFCDEGVVPRYVVADHPDRKPNPGMILRAIADFAIDPARSLIIGDRPADLEAGRRAGVRGALFQGGSLDAFVRRALADIGVGDAAGEAGR